MSYSQTNRAIESAPCSVVGFEILVCVPRLFTNPHDHFSLSGNGICLMMAGAARVVSDSIAASALRKQKIAVVFNRPPANLTKYDRSHSFHSSWNLFFRSAAESKNKAAAPLFTQVIG
jgi:hypothetical protein